MFYHYFMCILQNLMIRAFFSWHRFAYSISTQKQWQILTAYAKMMMTMNFWTLNFTGIKLHCNKPTIFNCVTHILVFPDQFCSDSIGISFSIRKMSGLSANFDLRYKRVSVYWFVFIFMCDANDSLWLFTIPRITSYHL